MVCLMVAGNDIWLLTNIQYVNVLYEVITAIKTRKKLRLCGYMYVYCTYTVILTLTISLK